MKNTNLNTKLNSVGPCLDHCYKQNGLYILLVILFSIVIGVIIGINLGFLIKSKGIAFDFNIEFEKNEKPENTLVNDIKNN